MKRNLYQLSKSQNKENKVKSKIGFYEIRLYSNQLDADKNLQDRINQIISDNQTAISYCNAGMYEDALKLQKMVLVRQREIFDQYHHNTIIAMNNLAVILLKMGKYEKALEWQQRVFNNSKIILGENHPNTINAKKKMANSIVRMNQKAIELSSAGMYKDALNLQQIVYDNQIELFGQNHPNTIIAMSNLADILLKFGQYEKALELQQRAFNNRKAVLGENHPRTDLSKNNIKITFYTMTEEVVRLSKKAQYDEALKLQLTILNNTKEIFGEEDPDTIVAKYNVILLLTRLKKRYNEALKLYENDLIKADPAWKFPPCPSIDSINIFDYFSECTQSDIITASPRKSFFVDAGPGTGKTYTLIQKLNYMVTQEGVEADGILVLCFTNAAVDEIRFRLKQFVDNGADRSLVLVDVRTFHSFAWWLINQANSELTDSGWYPVDMAGLSFDRSLVQAKRIVESFGHDVVAEWEYFIVDEIQDLTNSLGYFVLEIIDACLSVGCGVTVLGDACQAIYDYQESHLNSLKSRDFYKILFQKLYGKAYFVFLSENHRQTSELISLTNNFRKAILSFNVYEMERAVGMLESKLETIDFDDTGISKRIIDKIRSKGTISFLFRNNGETLIMSSDLRKNGILHRINVSESNNCFASWIADVFAEYKDKTISEEVFLNLYYENTGKEGSEVWYRLQRLMHTDNNTLDVRPLLDAIAKSKIDDSLLRATKIQNIIVSNIHRAKGREYDCVIVDKSYIDSLSADSGIEEFKTLYVAVTRPKRRLYLAPLHQPFELRKIRIFATDRKRWGKSSNGKITFLEFNSIDDIDYKTFLFIPVNTFSDIAVGDALYFKKEFIGGGPYYIIVHEHTGKTVGTLFLDSDFLKDIMSYMRLDTANVDKLPSRIEELYVSGIYSQVVDSEFLDSNDIVGKCAPNGVWKWIEIVGIGRVVYDS